MITTPDTIAPLKNVALANALIERSLNRSPQLPGIVSLSGPSGYGKSSAAAYAAHKHRAYYVECRSAWTKKALLIAICKEMGLNPAKTIYEMVDQIGEQLSISDRPLLIDEMDHLVEKKSVEIVRDIYEVSQGTILLIGEENFPSKLQRWERFHNRVLEFGLAQPCDTADTQHLAKLYVPSIQIAPALLERLARETKGVARRIAVNLDDIRKFAEAEGIDQVSVDDWGKRHFSTGAAPIRGVR